MKKLNIFLLLSTIFIGNLISMEVSEGKQEAPILNLPDEVILYMLEQEVRQAIDNWNDVFEEAPNVDISLIQDLSKTCKKFRDLCQDSLVFLNNFKNKKIKRLLENLKSESLEAHKNISKEELNNLLTNLLNNISNFENDCKEELKNAVKLIFAGADVNTKDNDGNTVLVWAEEYGHKEIAKILIRTGADVNIQNNYGWNALIWAAYKGYKEIVEMLINKGASINAKDGYGRTALMWAARMGWQDIVRMLLNNGADVDNKDNDGKTVLDWATLWVIKR